MTPVQRSATGMLFVAVLILGGWAWSQDDPTTSPSDDTAVEAAAASPTKQPSTKAAATPNSVSETPGPEDPATAPPLDANQAPIDQPTTDPQATIARPKSAPATAGTLGLRGMMLSLWIFVLAVFLGIEVISKVPPTLHTPLMSGSNAISGITLVGAVIVAAAVVSGNSSSAGTFARFLGFIAVALAMINAVGGFLVTHRMLAMFTRK